MAAADRHLLFGLLALQNGLIDQVQLVAAFQAWTRDKARTLASQLVARGDLDADARAGLEAIVALHVRKHGDVEKSLAAVPTNRSTRASLADLGEPEIEATLARIGQSKNVRATEADDDNDPNRTAGLSVGAATSDGQRFRLLRPHARGGLGEVFVALDAELHREVALKQILEKHADDPISRQRFVAEAEITGGLEHPGVVPVYGLGTYGGGRPYYAMRFINGDSLKEAIEHFHRDDTLKNNPGRRSLELRKLLRRFLDVCNAVDYAHSRGVIHRDIKPANIILGKHGETLVVDWGLAKAIGRADPSVGEQTIAPFSSGSSETLPGSALGTPAYMSPEQARGELNRLGPRSDVYSLGATLYCLLTGTAPFEGEDIGDILRAVQEGQFQRPSQRDSVLDKALEAVCVKAMATQSEDRYHTAKALADDLERWMADEPVTARREPISSRARRWARRNRTAVAAAAVALVAGVVGLSAVLAVQTQAKADIARALENETRANTALAAANAELTRSKAAIKDRYDLAVDAIATFHTGVTEDFLLHQDQFKELRDRLLTSAADFYGKLGALLGKETDLASRRALAQSNFELANLTSNVGSKQDALAAHRAVLAAREALAAESRADAALPGEVGLSLNAVASLLETTMKTDEALAAYRRSESLLKGLAAADPQARAALANCRARIGHLLFSTGRAGDLDAARAAHEAALADRRALAAARPDAVEPAVALAQSLDVFGHFKENIGQTAEALDSYREGRALMARAAEAEPTVTSHRQLLSHLMNHVGLCMLKAGKRSEGEAECRRAIAIEQKLADDYPAVTGFRGHLADSHHTLGTLLLQSGKPSEAELEVRRALAIKQKLVDDYPADNEFRIRLVYSHCNLGDVLSRTGKPSEAEAAYRKALAIQQKLADDNPAFPRVHNELAYVRWQLGTLFWETGRSAEAEAQWRQNLAIQKKLADDNPADTQSRLYHAGAHKELGVQLALAGNPRDGETECRRAVAILQKLVHDHPKVPLYRDWFASAYDNLGDVVRSLGRAAEARDCYERAIALVDRLIGDDPTTRSYDGLLARSLRRRGLSRRDLGDPAGAAADTQKALGLFDRLASSDSGEWYEIACCRAALLGLARRDGAGVSAAASEEEAAQAMRLLRKAGPSGYRDRVILRGEPALDSLRDLDDFKLMMMDLTMPAEPFARSE
jgi:serine/threonine-protein kinase